MEDILKIFLWKSLKQRVCNSVWKSQRHLSKHNPEIYLCKWLPKLRHLKFYENLRMMLLYKICHNVHIGPWVQFSPAMTSYLCDEIFEWSQPMALSSIQPFSKWTMSIPHLNGICDMILYHLSFYIIDKLYKLQSILICNNYLL